MADYVFKPHMTLSVNSSILGKWYTINRFTDYDIDLDLETDSDSFSFTFVSPDGIYTGLVSRFDPIKISYNGEPILRGTVDSVEYIWDEDNSYIKVTGRDMVSVLIDNDALPATLNNVKPNKYIEDKCKEYGIKYVKKNTANTIKELVISCGESECSIINNILLESDHRLWFSYDTLYSGEWDTGGTYKYIFTRGTKAVNQGIPIKSLRLKEDSRDTKTEVRTYGSQNDNGTNKLMGKATNDALIKRGIKRRLVKRSYKENSSTKYSAGALKDIRDGFRDDIELEIVIYHRDYIFKTNTVCKVIDRLLGIDGTFFIRSVAYSKSLSSGSLVTLTMIPSDSTFNTMWKTGLGVASTDKSKLSEKLSAVLSKLGK